MLNDLKDYLDNNDIDRALRLVNMLVHAELVKEALIEIRELIEDEEHWTTRTQARNVDGVPVPPLSSDATSYCLIGAITKVISNPKYTNYDIYNAISCKLSSRPVMLGDFNDKHTHDEVLEKIDRALGWRL